MRASGSAGALPACNSFHAWLKGPPSAHGNHSERRTDDPPNLNVCTRPNGICSSQRWGCLLISSFAGLFAASCGRRADPAPKPQQPPPFEFLGAWGDKGEGPGKLDAPVAFAADALGRVFFADPGAGFVHKFESSGTPLLSFEDSRLRHASGIAVDSGGAIYVADAERGNILIFFPDGTFLRAMRIAAAAPFLGPARHQR